jgi:hypothetical protein
MSDNLAVPMKSAATRGGADDTRVLAQVEKWMAVIREFKQEQTKN